MPSRISSPRKTAATRSFRVCGRPCERASQKWPLSGTGEGQLARSGACPVPPARSSPGEELSCWRWGQKEAPREPRGAERQTSQEALPEPGGSTGRRVTPGRRPPPSQGWLAPEETPLTGLLGGGRVLEVLLAPELAGAGVRAAGAVPGVAA